MRINQKMYEQLYRRLVLEKNIYSIEKQSLANVRQKAMCIKKSTSLTAGEEEACKNIFKEA